MHRFYFLLILYCGIAPYSIIRYWKLPIFPNFSFYCLRLTNVAGRLFPSPETLINSQFGRLFQLCRGDEVTCSGPSGSSKSVEEAEQLSWREREPSRRSYWLPTWPNTQKHICVSMWPFLAPHRCCRIQIINRIQI